MKHLLHLLFSSTFFLASNELIAQPNLGHTWSKTLSNSQILGGSIEASAIVTDAGGNSYITGLFQQTADFDPGTGVANLTSVASGDIFIAKYDVNGNYIFAKRIGGSGAEFGRDIARDASGNIYVVGQFSATIDCDPGTGVFNLTGTGANDVFIAKYDLNGNFLMAKWIGGVSGDDGRTITVDPLGNIYIGGYFTGTVDFDPGAAVVNLTAPSGLDGFIAKYNSSGEYLYAKSISGTGDERIYSIKVDAGNNLCVSGHFNGTSDFDPGAGTVNLVSAGQDDVFIAKYDVNGNYVFAKRIGGTEFDQGLGMAVDGSGNMIITGWFRTPTVDFDPGAGVANLTLVGADDIFLAKYDVSGNFIFAKSIGGTSTDQGKNVVVDANDNIFITGEFSETVDFDPGPGTANRTVTNFGIFIAKYDPSGNYQYAVGVGSSMRGNDIGVDGNGNIFATGMISTTVDFDPGAGTAQLSAPSGLQNTFLASYNSTGMYRYAGALGGYPNTFFSEEGSKISKDASGNIYIAGITQGTVDFDPGPGVANLSTGSISNIYFAKYDANGNYVFAKLLSSGSTGSVEGIVLDAAGNIYVTGSFQTFIDVDPGSGSVFLSALGSQDIFFAKYDVNGNYLYGKQISGTSTEVVGGLAIDGSGNLHIGGYFYGTVDFDPGVGTANLVATSGDGFIAKYDASGNYVYAKKFTSTSYTVLEGLVVDASANVIVSGRLNGSADFDPGAGIVNITSAGGDDIFIAKYNNLGNYVFAKRVGSTSNDYSLAVAVDASGNLAITGGFVGTVDFDPGAVTVNLTSSGGNDIYIAKYDASGNYVFARSFAGASTNDFGRAIAFDISGNIYATGEFSNTTDFDGGIGTANLVTAGGNDAFIIRYDPAGNYIYAKSIGGIGGEYGFDILVDGSGDVFLTGRFSSTADFDPNANSELQTSLNSNNIFFAKYNQCTSASITSISTAAANTTVSGVTAITDGGCRLLATVTPNGTNPISGILNGNVWIETALPTYAGQPFVARHYEITPASNASTATGIVTLYFTQQEFNDFNSHPASILDLPTGAADATGKANLRIAKYAGTTNNGSGLPASYTNGAAVIDPVDSDIIWNSTLSRWEVSVNVTGFSGFIVQTHLLVLPLTLLEFNGQLLNNNGILNWKTIDEQNTESFDIERSTDGRNYSMVGNTSAFATPGLHYYNFTDNNISSLGVPVIYYRLKQKDNTGRYTYSKTVALAVDKNKNIVLLYPNPVKNEVGLTITTEKTQQIRTSVIDYSGRIVKQQQWNINKGSTTFSVDLSTLANGMYFMEIKGETINERKPFLKQ